MAGFETALENYTGFEARLDEPRTIKATSSTGGLAQNLTQELAANIGLAREVDGELLIACRTPLEIEASAIRGLAPEQYRLLALTAQATTYKSMSDDLELPQSTLRTRMHDLHKSLGKGIRSKEEAGTFLPIENSKLAKIRLKTPELTDGKPIPIALTFSEAEIFSLIAQHYNTEQIANIRSCSMSAVRSCYHNMYETLDIPKDIHRGVTLRRLAGGLHNLFIYQGLIEQVDELLANIAINNAEIRPSLEATDTVHTLTNRQLLEKLQSAQYVPEGTLEHGNLSLNGLVAALMIHRPKNTALMVEPASGSTVKNLINKQTAVFLARLTA
jgi:hypothetical protein